MRSEHAARKVRELAGLLRAAAHRCDQIAEELADTAKDERDEIRAEVFAEVSAELEAQEAVLVGGVSKHKPPGSGTGSIRMPGKKPATEKKFIAVMPPLAPTAVVRRHRVKTKLRQQCLCGCGRLVTRYFARGHNAKFLTWLDDIRNGLAQPEHLLPLDVVEALGPWVENSLGGLDPSRHYEDLRPEARNA